MSKFLNSTFLNSGVGSNFYIPSGTPIVYLPATTTLADVIVSGGNTTSCVANITSPTEGLTYYYQIGWTNDVSDGHSRIYFNADRTNANYTSGTFCWNNTSLYRDDNTADAVGISCNVGRVANMSGIFGIQNGVPFMLGDTMYTNTVTRNRTWGHWFETGSTITSVEIYNSVARISNDTYVKLWSLDSTPIASVVASGTVSSMTLSGFNLTEGKSYMINGGFNLAAQETGLQLKINNDGTAANYKRGLLSSTTQSNNNTIPVIPTTTAGTSMIRFYGFVGLVNGIPHMHISHVGKTTAQVAGSQDVIMTTAQSFTSIVFNSLTGSNITSGSWANITEID